MHLDDRHLDRGDGVPERERVVGEGAGVEDDAAEALAFGRLEPVDELALVVRLTALDAHPVTTRMLADQAVELRERDPPVDGRLAGAEEVEVGAVQDQRRSHGHL